MIIAFDYWQKSYHIARLATIPQGDQWCMCDVCIHLWQLTLCENFYSLRQSLSQLVNLTSLNLLQALVSRIQLGIRWWLKNEASKKQLSKEIFYKWQQTNEREHQSMMWLHADMDCITFGFASHNCSNSCCVCGSLTTICAEISMVCKFPGFCSHLQNDTAKI